MRFEAVELLAAGMAVKDVAAKLRVTARSVRRWRAALAEGGEQALASKGRGGSACRLDEAQLKVLEQALDEGPAAHGWIEDQHWTLPRIARLVFEAFLVRYTLGGISYVLHRIGWTPQVPQHVAAERDEQKVTTWVKETWPHIKVLPPRRMRGSYSPTRPGSRCAHPRLAPGPVAG